MKPIESLFRKLGVTIEVLDDPNKRYARIMSDDGKHEYIVKEHLWYSCTCPDYQYRERECKHIKKFKEQIKKEAER